MTFEAIFLFELLWRRSLAVWKDHVTRFLALAAAVFHVQAEVVLQDIVVFRKAQLLGRSIDRCGGPLQIPKRSPGCFVEFKHEARGPDFLIRHSRRTAVPLIPQAA